MGHVLVEITGIPWELLGSMGLEESDSRRNPSGDCASCMEYVDPEAREGPLSTSTGDAPSIHLMKLHVVERRVANADCEDGTQKTVSQGEGGGRPTGANAESMPGPGALPFKSHGHRESWNQHCCGANGIRKRRDPVASLSIINYRRRHDPVLEPEIIKIR